MIDTIKHMLGGRVAEELKLKDISTGASNDLERATGLARDMITKYGFSEKLGLASFSGNDEVFLGRDFSTRQNYSEEVAAEVDHEIRRLLDDCHKAAKKILVDNDEAFERVAQALLKVETLDGDQFERLFKGEVTAEELEEEVKKHERSVARKNKKEAEETAKIVQEENRKKAEAVAQIINNGKLPQQNQAQSPAEEEDRVGYEEYKRATKKTKDDSDKAE